MNRIRKVFSAPVFDDEIKTQQAYLLNIILWSLIWVPIPFLIYAFILAPQIAGRAVIQAVVGEIVNIGLLIALHRGYVRFASTLQVGTFWLFFTIIAVTESGVQSEAYLLGYGLVIAIAGLLLGQTGALMITVLSLTSGAVMVYEHSTGIIRNTPPSAPLTTWLVSLVLFPVGPILQQLAARTVRISVERARASEERYRLISIASSDYTFSTELNPEGRMKLNWVAGAFDKITGYDSMEEYVANGGWQGHLHPEDVEMDEQAFVRLAQNQPSMTDVRTFRKGGEISWVRVHANPVWDAEQNRIVGIVGGVRDITERKLAEERQAHYRAMLEKVMQLGKRVTETTDFVTTLQRIWRIVHDDLGFDRLGIFLYNSADNSVDGSYGTNRQGEMVEEWELHLPLDGKTEETIPFINLIHDENGLYFTRDFSADHHIPKGHIMEGVKEYAAVAAWVGDRPIGVICVDNLITGRAITEEQLEALRLFAGYAGLAIQNARLNDILEDDLAHRQSLINELEKKNAELERFTYTVSHDLKSPLVTITGFLGFIEKDVLAGNTEKIHASIDRISKAAEKMQNLLNDLLKLSRIGRLMNEPETIPFQEIVTEALEQIRGQLEANHIRVELQGSPLMVYGDKIRLVEVLQNLLDNAAKFSKNQPDALIRVGTQGPDESGSVTCFVSDNGIGIAPQFHDKIFGLFNKLDPTIEGTGVGLTLVKRIIEVHGGTIWLESQPGKGATFYFTLPGKPEKE